MSTDKAEMFYILEKSEGKHMNIGMPLLVYNTDNSRNYENSYFNTPYSNKRQEIDYYIINNLDNIYKHILDFYNKENNH